MDVYETSLTYCDSCEESQQSHLWFDRFDMMSSSSLTIEDSSARALSDGITVHAHYFTMEDSSEITVKGALSVFSSVVDIQNRASIVGE